MNARDDTSEATGGGGNLEDITSLSYEQAREELVGVVRALEAGGQSLEDSLALWERGEALADRCQSWLTGAREKLEAAKARREVAEQAESP